MEVAVAEINHNLLNVSPLKYNNKPSLKIIKCTVLNIVLQNLFQAVVRNGNDVWCADRFLVFSRSVQTFGVVFSAKIHSLAMSPTMREVGSETFISSEICC